MYNYGTKNENLEEMASQRAIKIKIIIWKQTSRPENTQCVGVSVCECVVSCVEAANTTYINPNGCAWCRFQMVGQSHVLCVLLLSSQRTATLIGAHF